MIQRAVDQGHLVDHADGAVTIRFKGCIPALSRSCTISHRASQPKRKAQGGSRAMALLVPGSKLQRRIGALQKLVEWLRADRGNDPSSVGKQPQKHDRLASHSRAKALGRPDSPAG